jgi:hypothetical protein
MNEKQQIVRSPEPEVRAAREAEERRRVAEIARDIQELGRALEGRDRQARFGTAVRAKSSLAQAGQTATGVEDGSTPEPESLPTGRATKTAQDAHRGAVAEMQRLTAWKNTETEAAARQGAEEKALGEEANRKAAEEKLAAVAAAPREDARQVADERLGLRRHAKWLRLKLEPLRWEPPNARRLRTPDSRQRKRRARQLKGT